MTNNLVTLSGAVTGTDIGLWSVVAVLLIIYVIRRRSRKDKEQDSLR